MRSLGIFAVGSALLVVGAFALIDTGVQAAHANEAASSVVGKDWAVVAAQKQ